MAQPCPRIDPLRLPHIGRNLPGVLAFAPACMPGTATSAGCADDQKFFTILVKWDDFVKNGWTAPGGNRYWAGVAAETSTAGRVMLRLMADASKKQFRYRFAKDDLKNLSMSQVMGRYAGQWVPDFGVVRVEVWPDEGETALAFIRRGGYLLHVTPNDSPFGGNQYTDAKYKPVWAPGDLQNVGLIGAYRPATHQIDYVVRAQYKGAWDKVAGATFGKIAAATAKFCASTTGEEMIALQTAAALYPGAQEFAVAIGIAQGVCNFNVGPCAPRPDQPVPAAPVTAGGVRAGTLQSQYAVTAGAFQAPPGYPAGTITWYDPAAGGYRLAIPEPGPGVTHRVITAGVIQNPPRVTVVDKATWERATLPWIRRGRTKIGLMVGGVAAAGGLTAYAVRG